MLSNIRNAGSDLDIGHLHSSCPMSRSDPFRFLRPLSHFRRWNRVCQMCRPDPQLSVNTRLIFSSWTCRFCGGTFADRTLAITHAIECDKNEEVHSCVTCALCQVGENTDDGYRHVCNGNKDGIDIWMKHCLEWLGA